MCCEEDGQEGHHAGNEYGMQGHICAVSVSKCMEGKIGLMQKNAFDATLFVVTNQNKA